MKVKGLKAWAVGLAALTLTMTAWSQPAPLKDAKLRDQHGAPIGQAGWQGRIVLMNFVFTGCSATCPTQVAELAQLLDSLPAAVRSQVRFASVSLDPFDTPATLRAFAKRLDADRPDWRFFSGPPDDIERIATRMAAFDPSRQARTMADHRTALYLYDARGELVQRYAGVPVDQARLKRELTALATTPTLSSIQAR